MKIVIGSASFKAELNQVADYLKSEGHKVADISDQEGCSDILNIALKAGKMVSNGTAERAITIDDYAQIPFMVMSKFANNVVAPAFDEYSAELTAEHNNANILCLAAKVSAPDFMMRLVKIFTNSHFDAGRHLVRTDMLDEMLKEEKK